ncbi:MAG: type II restriction endonuclease [Bacteroidaceae bacterium]|nr:type II restriction endonuclease [Bacteroidaceae bacterium]
MENKNFELFMSQLYETNATLDFYCDFDKIKKNVEDISISLNTLNYLIGQEDLANAVKRLWERDPRVFQVLDILIATRKKDKKKYLQQDKKARPINELFQSPDGIIKFLTDTGLAKLIKNKDIKNFVDYVFGVETGLDSNARKNRSGKVMEKWIFDIFTKNGINCQQQVESKKFPDVKNVLRKDIKRFDFVITTKKNTYLVEVNFYADGGGSKPSEVARAYSELSPKINGIKGYKFVWITDGMGWDGVGSFKEAYESIPYVYNITNITSFINLLKLEL